jgi:phosphate-selective porin OprO/OprP|tara:strand:+ start:81 stop:1307 length:1227 start_codon:yes stop_codon:yes gene_type:complete
MSLNSNGDALIYYPRNIITKQSMPDMDKLPKNKTILQWTAVMMVLNLLLPCHSQAGEGPVGDAPDKFGDLWDIPHIYSDSNAFWITDLKLVGRYQWQNADVDSEQGNYSSHESRRFRIGTEAKILGGDWKLKAEISINDEFSPFYDYITDAYIKYQGNPAFNLTIGKHRPIWSYEMATSSRKILTLERSLLVNQVSPKKSTGISARGEIDNWSYVLGLFSGDIDDELGNLDDVSGFSLASIGYDYSEKTRFEQMAWRLDWAHNNDAANNAAKPYRDSFSLSHSLKQGVIGLHTDFIHASGYSDDAYGIILLPTYDISDKLQLVARYTRATGDNDNLKVQKRYENNVPHLTDNGLGENYQSFYLGLNYYINEHKLKLMTGVEYAEMEDAAGDGGDYNGWTVFSGLRFYF